MTTRSEPPNPDQLNLDCPIFLIGKNHCGQWVARDADGLYGGLFTSRDAATRYALFENGHHPERIYQVVGYLELYPEKRPATPLPLDDRKIA